MKLEATIEEVRGIWNVKAIKILGFYRSGEPEIAELLDV